MTDKPYDSGAQGEPRRSQGRRPSRGGRPDRGRSGGGRSGGGRSGGGRPDGGWSGGGRPDRGRSGGGRPDRGRPDDRSATPEERPAPPGLEPREDEPRLPDDLDLRRLDRGVRAELRGLSKERADIVAAHLLMAGELIDENPALAYEHALAAKRRAARLPMAREGVAETAYAAEKYDVALGEYRALRRMTGSSDYLPVMADCERALGRPQQALRLIREATGQPMDPAAAIELRIIEAGARHDLGQQAEAARLLRAAVSAHSGRVGQELRAAVARLHYALADVLLDLGQGEQAREEFAQAAELDSDQVTDAAERLDSLNGMAIEFDPSDDGEEDTERAD